MHPSPIPTQRPEPERASLPSPRELGEAYALSPSALVRVNEARARIAERLHTGRGPLVAIVGPCSLHSEEAARAYAERLAPLAERLRDDVTIVMRAYFEKPRTTIGWKGFLYDPDMDGSHDLARGLERARALLVELSELGLPLATEILDPLTAPYFEDCLSWAAIGARTAESQIHRQLVSGLECPVGFKNGTDGSVSIALAAMESARVPHTHLGIDRNGRISIAETRGNRDTHVVLRGGRSGPNYDAESITRLAGSQDMTLPLLVDCSHGNSGKDYRKQCEVAEAVMAQLPRRDVRLMGLMIESHVEAGRQEPGKPASPHKSVTDACIGFEATQSLLESMAKSAHPPRSFLRSQSFEPQASSAE